MPFRFFSVPTFTVVLMNCLAHPRSSNSPRVSFCFSHLAGLDGEDSDVGYGAEADVAGRVVDVRSVPLN